MRRLREHGMNVSAADRHRSSQPVIEQYTRGRLQLPDDRHPGGRRPGPARPARPRSSRGGASWPQRYQRLLSGLAGLQTIRDPDYGSTNFQSFWMLLPEDVPVTRDDLLSCWPNRASRPAAASWRRTWSPRTRLRADPLPVTERLTAHSLILPLFHEMTEAEQDLVVSVIQRAYQRSGPVSLTR